MYQMHEWDKMNKTKQQYQLDILTICPANAPEPYPNGSGNSAT